MRLAAGEVSVIYKAVLGPRKMAPTEHCPWVMRAFSRPCFPLASENSRLRASGEPILSALVLPHDSTREMCKNGETVQSTL